MVFWQSSKFYSLPRVPASRSHVKGAEAEHRHCAERVSQSSEICSEFLAFLPLLNNILDICCVTVFLLSSHSVYHLRENSS